MHRHGCLSKFRLAEKKSGEGSRERALVQTITTGEQGVAPLLTGRDLRLRLEDYRRRRRRRSRPPIRSRGGFGGDGRSDSSEGWRRRYREDGCVRLRRNNAWLAP